MRTKRENLPMTAHIRSHLAQDSLVFLYKQLIKLCITFDFRLGPAPLATLFDFRPELWRRPRRLAKLFFNNKVAKK